MTDCLSKINLGKIIEYNAFVKNDSARPKNDKWKKNFVKFLNFSQLLKEPPENQG